MILYKISISLLVFILSFSLTNANEIDRINTDEDVNEFMEKHFGEKYKEFTVADTNYIWYYHSKNNPYSLIADTLGMKFWYKAKFNNDSNTDLLVYGSYIQGKASPEKRSDIFGIIDAGEGNYQIIKIFSVIGKPFPIVIHNNSESLILLYQTVENDFIYENDPRYNYLGVSNIDVIMATIDDKPYICVDTLIYEFEIFVEYNSNPKPKLISEIYFENSCGMLACYIMKLTIDGEGNSTMIGGEYYEDKIKFFCKIKNEQFKEIVELITYLNFNKLADGYSSLMSDAASVELNIKYDDKLKEIYDYGFYGTLGLRRLYKMLFDLRFNQNWRR